MTSHSRRGCGLSSSELSRTSLFLFFFFNDTATTEIYTLSLHDALPISTGFSGDVTVAIGTNAGGGTLSGARTHAAVSGVATFSGLSIDKAGTGYTLTATGAGSATSAAFNITAGGAPPITVNPGDGQTPQART